MKSQSRVFDAVQTSLSGNPFIEIQLHKLSWSIYNEVVRANVRNMVLLSGTDGRRIEEDFRR